LQLNNNNENDLINSKTLIDLDKIINNAIEKKNEEKEEMLISDQFNSNNTIDGNLNNSVPKASSVSFSNKDTHVYWKQSSVSPSVIKTVGQLPEPLKSSLKRKQREEGME
jgi:hypothetical protein